MAAVDLCTFNHGLGIYIRLFFPERYRGIKYEYKRPNPWLNIHKSTAAMNFCVPNMTNTVIFMTLGYLRIRHTTAVPFSPLHK